MSNEVDKQVPGVPDGYRLVRIGAPLKGEYLITGWGKVQQADENMYEYCWPIVEPVEPPIPKTEEVILNKYLVRSNDGGHWMLVVCSAGYADTFFSNYKLIGPSETIEVEVGV